MCATADQVVLDPTDASWDAEDEDEMSESPVFACTCLLSLCFLLEWEFIIGTKRCWLLLMRFRKQQVDVSCFFLSEDSSVDRRSFSNMNND